MKPKNRSELNVMIEREINRKGIQCDLNHIDTSLITDMSTLFMFSEFNGDISKWDVSNLKHIDGMFKNSVFSGSLKSWRKRPQTLKKMFGEDYGRYKCFLEKEKLNAHFLSIPSKKKARSL